MRIPFLVLCVISCAGLVACDSGNKTAAASQPGGAATAPASATPKCTLSMGWDPWMPYQYEAADGSVVGLDVEIASTVAAGAGCALKTVQGSWQGHLARLESGELDMVAGATETPAREKFANFSAPYRNEEFDMYIRAGDNGKYTADSLEGMLKQGAVVGTVMDYYYGGIVAELQDRPEYTDQFKDAEVSELNFRRLQDGDIDAFLEDPFVASAMMRRQGSAQAFQRYPVSIHTGQVSFMFSRKGVDEETFKRFNASLENMKQSGALDAILNRYRD